jgi:hypothetical protein
MKSSILVVSLLLALGASAAMARSSYCWISVGDSGFYQPWNGQAGGAGWYKGSALNLYIVSTSRDPFTSGQQSDISTALGNWNSTSGSGLSITTSVVTGRPSPTGLYIIVQFGSVTACDPTGQAPACTEWTYNTTTGNAVYSTISVNTSKGSSAMLSLMAHEMGHTYMIADCPDSVGCSTSYTTMDGSSIIEGSSPTSPLCCDLDLLYEITPTNRYGSFCSP